jgi:hypothetical protein
VRYAGQATHTDNLALAGRGLRLLDHEGEFTAVIGEAAPDEPLMLGAPVHVEHLEIAIIDAVPGERLMNRTIAGSSSGRIGRVERPEESSAPKGLLGYRRGFFSRLGSFRMT